MAVTKDTVYIKSEQNVEVKKREVRLGDILSLECANEKIAARIKTILLLKIPDTGKHRYVVSILKIIECIHREYPNLDIQNLGVPDIIITYEEQKVTNPIGHFLKIVGVVAALDSPLWRLITMWMSHDCFHRFMSFLWENPKKDSVYWN